MFAVGSKTRFVGKRASQSTMLLQADHAKLGKLTVIKIALNKQLHLLPFVYYSNAFHSNSLVHKLREEVVQQIARCSSMYPSYQ